MTKEKFAAALAKEMRGKGIKLTVPAAEKFVNALAKTMAEGLARDRKVLISNFGAFEAMQVGAKVINSPRADGKKFFMPPTDIIKWHPSGKIRVRAESKEVDDATYEEIKGHPQEEEIDLPPVLEEIEASEIKPSANPYEVKISYIGSGNKAFDRNSPMVKLLKSLFRQFISEESNKMVITPERFVSQISFSVGDELRSSKTLPRESHAVIVEKIIDLSGGRESVSLFGQQPVRFEKRLTPFGTELIISKIQ